MDDFGKFVYLDVEKTGSTYISSFLESYARLPRRKFDKHARVTSDYDPKALYFISARHPFEQYKSLYQHGYGRKGLLQKRLRQSGKGHLYSGEAAGFPRWLEFVLDEANAGYLGKHYQEVNCGLIGFQTFRFLRLSMLHPIRKMARVRSMNELREQYHRSKIHQHIIRNESLDDDLRNLIEVHLSKYFDQIDLVDKAAENVDRIKNASSKMDISEDSVNPDLMALLYRKEEFLFQEIYADCAK